MTTYGCPKPVAGTITPDKGINNQVVNVTITGEKFNKTTTVKLVQEGQADIIATDLNLVSDKEITCSLDLNGKAAGKWDVAISNIGRWTKKVKTVTIPGGFTIENTVPTITAVNPSQASNKGPVTLSVTGTELHNDVSVKLVGNGSEIPMTNIKANESYTGLTGDVDLTGIKPGAYQVVVTDAAGKTGSFDGFTVSEAVAAETSKTTTAETKKPTPSPEATPITIDQNGLLKPIFFDYDKSVIKANQQSSLKANLAVLKENKDLYIVLGGHADERGSVEYNLILSAKRAQAVKKQLVNAGIKPSKIIVFAYGKEFPAKKGHGEDFWWFNRRVDITLWKAPPSKKEALTENTNL
jgi:peptidoglycan-associated lipoprotein